MDGERSIVRNCVIITALFVPCVVIAVVTALICVVKACLYVMEKLCVYIQQELDLFNEIHEDNQETVWDKGGLFVAFIKGEDVHDRLQKKNTLRPKTDMDTNPTITERISSGIGMSPTEKRPMNGDIFLRELILERPWAHFPAYHGITGKSTLPYARKSQDCTRIGIPVSDSNQPVTGNVVRDANLRRVVKGKNDHGHENTMASLRANYGDHCQIADASSDVDLQEGESIPRSQISVLSSQNSAEKQVNLSQDIEQPSFRAERKKKNGKITKVACSNQVVPENSKKVKLQEISRSPVEVNKGKKIIRPTNVRCSSEVGVNDKVEASQNIRRSSLAIKKRNKRRIAAANESYSSQIATTEQLAKKKRKEPVTAPHCRNFPAPQSLNKMNKKKKSQRGCHSPIEVRQRKMVAVEVRPNAPFIGKQELVKADQKLAAENAIPVGGLLSANLQLQATHREPTSVQNEGELLNAKRPLPVTPFRGQSAEETIDMDQASLPETPSVTELVFLMEKLQIAPSEDPSSDYVADISYSHSDDDSYGSEQVNFPELQNRREQAQVTPSEEPASAYVAGVSDYSVSDVDSDDAEYALFPELQSLGKQVLQIIQLLP